MRRVALTAVCAVLAATAVFAHEGHDHDHDHAAESVSASSAAPEASEAPPAPVVLKHKFAKTSIKAPFLEQFTDDWESRWTPSEATKKTPVGGETWSYVGKWSVEESSVYPAIEGDKGLVAKSKATHHAISAPFVKPVSFADKPLVVQYEAKFQQGGNCGGGYLKLLEDGFQNAGVEFSDKTPWVVMFGPDLTCPGSKVHFIFRHKNPKTGEYEEKHLKLPPNPTIEKTTNLYTLIVKPDNSFQILINGDSVKSGSLLEDFSPAVNPPKEIDDPEDKKPEDWVDEAKIADPEATKPEDWDEDAPYEIEDEEAKKPEGWLDDAPLIVPDPEAVKPEEWDDEEDGDWVPPSVPNPKCEEAPGCGEWKRPMKSNPAYKGKWYAPMIDNPAYKGVWAPRKIDNPDFFEDLTPVKSLNKIGAVGIEIWTMTEDILFDNIYVGHSPEDAKALAAESFDIKRLVEAETAKIEDPLPPSGDDYTPKEFSKEPLAFLRQKVEAFVELARMDPVLALKSHPETAGVLAVTVLTLISMAGMVLGLVGGGSAPAPVKKAAEKVKEGAEKAKEAVKENVPVAVAGGEKKEEAVKKRK